MSFHPVQRASTWEKARRREAYRRFARTVKGKGNTQDRLLPLDEVRERLRLFEQTYVGVRPIPVDQIVGTAGRTDDFDRNFLPRRRGVRQRWQQVERVFPDGAFPPIVAYQLGDSYFVVDGHHRVAIARQLEMKFIDAEITRLKSNFKIPPGADVGRIIHAEQERLFMADSGLERARPEARIELSRSDGYVELLELFKVHGYDLMRQRGEVLAPEEIAGDWFDHIYIPAIDAIRQERLGEAFPSATLGDLFMWVYQRRRSLFPEQGQMGMEDAVREASRAKVKARRSRSTRMPKNP
ncbi:MAG: hypothetical protein H0U16_03555 [Actinobacteria bacterium]|nr:hypothetical protein [Actinomycetota bacterium]